MLLVLLLSNTGLIMPSSAMAQPTALAPVKQLIAGRRVDIQNLFANQPIASATVQMSAIVVNRLRQDLSKRTKIPAAKLKMLEAKPKTWNDGCFGLPKPDEICTQALVEGWRVVFSNNSQSNNSQRWIYRTDKQGRSYRLED